MLLVRTRGLLTVLLAGLLTALLAAARKLPGLSGLARLSGLSLLALLPLLPLLSLLALLSGLRLLTLLAVTRELLHLLAQFLGFAAQHFLLPALLKGLLFALVLLLGQLLLAASELREALQSLVHILLPLLGRLLGRGALAGFVLVLLRVEFEIEHAGQVAAGSLRPAASATAASKGDLDVTERGFGAQQML